MCYNMCMKNYDVIVIGGGPAGASAALYCARSGFSVCVIDGGASALLKAERIDNYYGTGGATGAALFAAGLDQARAAGAETLDGQVTFVSADDGFNVSSTAGELYGKKLIVATGASRARQKAIDDGAGISYCAVCDAFFYRKKRVGVIGAGAYARHEYETLAAVAASVALFTDGDTPSFEAEEAYTQKITGVKRDGEKLVGVALSDGKCVELDGLFVAVGVAGATALAKSMGILTLGDGSIKTDGGKTNVSGLFAAGDCTSGVKQVAKAVCDGMTAGLAAINELRGEKSGSDKRGDD